MPRIHITNTMHVLMLIHIHGIFDVIVLHKSLEVDKKALSKVLSVIVIGPGHQAS